MTVHMKPKTERVLTQTLATGNSNPEASLVQGPGHG